MSKIPDSGIGRRSEWDTGAESGIYGELSRTPTAEHLALLYSSHEERLDVSLSFCQLGLEAGDRCLYISNDVSRSEVIAGLAALGGSPEEALERGHLDIRPADEVYTGGRFDADGMVDTLVALVEESVRDGYEGLRVTGEIPWQTHDGVSFEDIVDYERQFDRTAPEFDFNALCQYDLRTLDDGETLNLVHVHPQLIYRRQLCENPFYRPPDRLAKLDDVGLSADQVLQTTYELSAARRAIEQREQRVGVLNRVLRHNLRNEMNVIRSHAELIDSASNDPDIVDSAATILETTGRLMDIAEDAKRIEKSVSGSTANRIPLNLRHAIERAAERTRNRYRNVALTCTVEDDTWVEVSEELEFALSELFETLAGMADDGSRIVVELDDERGANATLCLVAHCEDANLPQSEVQALVAGEETQLAHGSGLGLWLVNWIVELSGGQLAFRSTEGGQDVLLELVEA